MENTVYQRSDLLHRADDSQDNYSQPEQQAENGSSQCVYAQTHGEQAVRVYISNSSIGDSENKAARPYFESLLFG